MALLPRKLRHEMKRKYVKLIVLFASITIFISLYNAFWTDSIGNSALNRLLWLNSIDNGGNVTVHSVADAHSFMQSYSLDELSMKTVSIIYKNFSRRMPLFIDDKDKELFMVNKENRDVLEPLTSFVLRGEINVVRNGTYVLPHDCGWKSSAEFIEQTRTATKSEIALCPLLVPNADSFQHFVDGTLPKIAQAYELLRRPEVKLLLYRPTSTALYDMLKVLNVSEDRIVWYRYGAVYRADYMIFTCVTPPLHPSLWLRWRQLLRVPDTLQVTPNKATVMLITRAKSKNGGRNIVNLKKVQSFLRSRYGDNLVVFQGGLTLKQAIQTFSKVRLFIGVHGGAFYNLNFAPLSTTIIEFVPAVPDDEDVGHRVPFNIFWSMSDLLQQPYWRVPYVGENKKYDIKMNVTKLRKILDIVDRNAYIHVNTMQ